ncbi:protein phosphatase 2C domain-containing protein [Streptomyces sp. NPDC056485]|uniref:protein phosphatase 2C domain-containing protein n=1 Tax=Streptomyces sp. NPDC056485 TaxID=3345834 RepID=UPI00369D89AD
MSQQGADDWWQKLYGTTDPDPDPDPAPDPAPTPDPADTLESRFHSASSLTHRVPPQGPPEPGAVPPAPPVAAPAHSVLPRPRRGADPAPAPAPPPRDPRGPGTTGYGLGSVTVPPALPEAPSEPPARRWGAPPDRTPDGDTGPAPDTARPDTARPGAEAAAEAAGAGPGARPGGEPWAGSDPDPAAYLFPHPERDPLAEAEPTAPWEAPDTLPAVAPPGAGTTVHVGVQPLAGDPVAGEPWSEAGVRAGAGAAAAAVSGGGERPVVGFLGDRAPTYAAEPGALPVADPGALDELVPDTVLEGARHGAYTLRATSVRGDSARFRGEARRDFLLTARFGTGDDALVLAALAGGDRSASGAAEAAAELCRWIASAVGRSRERLADDLRAGRRDALRSGLQRLTDRGYGRLRAHAAELGLPEEAYTAGLRVLLLPIDPECKTRVCFGAGAGGLFRLREGTWQDLEPEPAGGAADGFRFRAAVARPRDTLLLCSGGLADPMREEGLLSAELAARWADPEPPGLAAFLADTQLRLKGYADDRTAAAVWEA